MPFALFAALLDRVWRSPDDPSGGGSDGAVTSTGSDDADSSDGHANDGVTFTAEQQAHIDRMVADRLKRDRAAQRRKAQQQQQQPSQVPTATQPAAGESALLAKLEDMELLRRFDKAVASMHLEDAQRDALEILYRAEKPDDAREWAKSRAQQLGWGATTTAPPNTNNPAAQGAAPTLPVNRQSPVAPTSDTTDPADAGSILKLNKAQILRTIAEKGRWEGPRLLRQQFEQQVGPMTITKGD